MYSKKSVKGHRSENVVQAQMTAINKVYSHVILRKQIYNNLFYLIKNKMGKDLIFIAYTCISIFFSYMPIKKMASQVQSNKNKDIPRVKFDKGPCKT